MSYVIVSDSAGNLPDEIIEKYNIEIVSLSYTMGGVERKAYIKGVKSDLKEFYEKLRNKEDSKTSLVPPEEFEKIFENIAKEGKDILYLGFTSGLSGTYQSSVIAADLVREKYPDVRIVTVDTLCASIGEGLIVYYAALMKEEGKSIDEIVSWIEENRLKLCHWFTVDDLFFLKRGGRVSTTTAIAGTVLGIKPILKVDNDGKLATVGKVRGRKQAINHLVEQFEKNVVDADNQIIGVVHGDCQDDADYLISEIKKRCKAKTYVCNYLDYVIGSHAGPGTLALFFLGEER